MPWRNCMERVLVIDPDPLSRQAMVTALLVEGFEAHTFEDDSAALGALAANEIREPDAIILDPGDGRAEGLLVCGRIRTRTDAPIIIVSTIYSERHVVSALRDGADEYLMKPVNAAELAARLRAILRRAGPNRSNSHEAILVGDLEIRLAEHEVRKRGHKIDLSPIEFRLLTCLAREPGRVLSHRTLMARVWGAEYVECRHYLRLYIRYLREKLEDDPSSPRLILSEWGLGYRLQTSTR